MISVILPPVSYWGLLAVYYPDKGQKKAVPEKLLKIKTLLDNFQDHLWP